jgi:hypothetical protein
MINKICKICNKPFTTYNKNAIFCSLSCRNNSMIKRIECVCIKCGKKFLVKPYIIKKRQGKFCSNNCHSKWISNNKGKNSYNYKPKIKCVCKQCNKEFFVKPHIITDGRGKFCSHKCHLQYNKGKNHKQYKEKVKKICKKCGKEFYIHSGWNQRGQGKFCYLKCKYEYCIKEKSSCWKGGSSFLPYCYKFNERRKKATRNFFNNTCIICGNEDFSRKISVHHVDHDKFQGCNGKPFNLVTLCQSCHGKEFYNEKDYEIYINKTLEEGFKWGIWNRDEYKLKVMYNE